MPAFYLLPFDTPGLELTPLAPLSIAAIPPINDPIRDRVLHLEPKDFSMIPIFKFALFGSINFNSLNKSAVF